MVDIPCLPLASLASSSLAPHSLGCCSPEHFTALCPVVACVTSHLFAPRSGSWKTIKIKDRGKVEFTNKSVGRFYDCEAQAGSRWGEPPCIRTTVSFVIWINPEAVSAFVVNLDLFLNTCLMFMLQLLSYTDSLDCRAFRSKTSPINSTREEHRLRVKPHR